MSEHVVLDDSQRKNLLALLYIALIEIRYLCNDKESTHNLAQVWEIADTFHNLPNELFSPEFDISRLKNDIKSTQEKYPKWSKQCLDEIERIIAKK